MERTPVTSDKVTSIGYDKQAEILEIEFINGSVYEYYNITPRLYKQLMKAPCLDRFLNTEIKCAYPYKLIS